MVGKAIEEGNPHMLHHVAALRGIQGGQEKLAKAQELVEKGMKVAESMTGTYKGTLKRFNGTVAALTKQFGQTVAEGMKPLYEWGTKVLKNFTDIDPESKRVIVAFASITAGLLALGPGLATLQRYVLPFVGLMTEGFKLVGVAVMTLLNPIKLLLTVVGAVASVISIAFSPVGLAIVAVTAFVVGLVAHLGGLKETWEAVRDASLKAWEWIKIKGVEAWEIVQRKAEEFWDWVQPAVQVLKGIFGVAWEAIKDGASSAWRWIQEDAVPTWNAIKEMVEGVWKSFVKWTTDAMAVVQDFVRENRTLVEVLSGVALTVGVGIVAWRSLLLIVGLTNSILTFFRVHQILATAALLAWHGAVLLTTVPVIVFNAILATLKFLFFDHVVGNHIGATVALVVQRLRGCGERHVGFVQRDHVGHQVPLRQRRLSSRRCSPPLFGLFSLAVFTAKGTVMLFNGVMLLFKAIFLGSTATTLIGAFAVGVFSGVMLVAKAGTGCSTPP